MTRSALALVSVVSALTLSACTGQWPDTYFFPKGYTNHDNTPISTPHGYNRSASEEKAAKDEHAANAQAWRNLVATTINMVEPALDMNRPVAVIASKGMTPLSASATNYVREIMVEMGYLVSLPAEANQTVDVHAVRNTQRPDDIDLTLSVVRSGTIVTHQMQSANIPHQIVESMRMPGFTTYPAAGPAPAGKPYSNLQQQ